VIRYNIPALMLDLIALGIASLMGYCAWKVMEKILNEVCF
jgi:hypothetical protein